MYEAPMTETLTIPTADHRDFLQSQGMLMVPLLESMDMREAERMAARQVADRMLKAGQDPAIVEGLLAEALRVADVGLLTPDDGMPVSDALVAELVAEAAAADADHVTRRSLLEKLINTPTGYRMFVFPNESKHQGKPHLTVHIGDEKVNISISRTPEVLAGDPELRGIGGVLKVIKKKHRALRKEWDASRPDDQKLENSRRRRDAGAKAKSSKR